ncbi:STN domain-containing protein [Aquimarina sp. U1-2]|uniref:STN domain-containing protein n=1 Tax=Aquimarina sp. U1-2 TaxID=2823141 RepID=UPI001AECA9C9|nr:STN domain-containing protein [Aquimarina sp. U1-2]MBP2834054.1 STN domain-containing protein [Aquimarina sp. U1-2]
MKYRIFSLLCIFLFGTLSVKSQESTTKQPKDVLTSQVTINSKNQTIETILATLEEDNAFSFSYIDSEIPLKKRVSIAIKNEELFRALDLIFENTLVDYIGFDDQIILVKKEDIQFIENIKNSTSSTYLYLAPISEYYMGSNKNGIRVNLDIVLKKLIALYKRPSDEFSYPTQLDSMRVDSLEVKVIDSLKIIKKKRKRNKIKLPKFSLKNVDIAYGFYASVASVFWTFSSSSGNREFNQNTIPDISVTLGNTIYAEGESTITGIGLHLTYFRKTGVHTNYLINTVFPNTLLTQNSPYDEDFVFAELPLSLGFKGQKKNFNYLIQPGIQIHRLLYSNVSPTYRVYQDQFFTNLNSNSTNNPDLSPYFDQNFNLIEADATKIRKWNVSAFLSFKIITKWSRRWKISIGPEVSYQLFSLYDANAPISQHRIQAGMGIIFAPIFLYM